MILFPCCKINIGLDVTARRQDGYHEVETAMIPVSGLCDLLEIVPGGEGGAEFVSSGLMIDCPPEKNLCLKAYGLMAERYGIKGVRMFLHKLIPYGAGLGGGSSDAACTIKGLDRIFKLDLDDHTMEALAAELGSDTAFFIKNTPGIARGRGEVLSPCSVMDKLSGKTLIIIKPPFGVSTAEAYGGITPRKPSSPLGERLAGDITTWRETVKNDFEPHIFNAYPILGVIKDSLYGAGAVYASMSGSGSAVYGIFETPAGLSQKPLYTPLPDQTTAKFKAVFPDAFVYQQIIK